MANYLQFGEGFLAACGVLMAVVAALLWRHHAVRPAWGLRWLAAAMGCGALINLMAPLLITAVWREEAPGAALSGVRLVAMWVGFGSLAAMIVGTRYYMLRPPPHPWRLGLLVWLAAQAGTLVGVGVFRIGLLADLITAGIFVHCAWLAFTAMRKEPTVGHGLVGLAFMAQPTTLLALLVAGGDVVPARYLAAAPYAAVGLVFLSATLIRLRNELACELHARTQAEAQAQRSAAALRQSHAVQQALLHQSPVPTAHSPVLEGKLQQTFWNQAWYTTFGHAPGSKEGVAGSDFDFYADPNARDHFLQVVLERGHVGPFETRLKTANGAERLCHIYSSLIHSNEDQFVVTSFYDITEQRRNELHLREFEAMVQSADDVMLLFADQQITFANVAAERMFGISARDMVGRKVTDISPAIQADGRTSFDAAQSYVRLALEGAPQRFYWEHARAKGEVFTAQVALTAIESAPGQLVAVLRDVTEQKRAQAELALSRTQLMANLDNTPTVAVQWFSPDGRVLYWNPASEALYGVAAAEVLGRLPIGALYTNEAEFQGLLDVFREIEASGKAYGPYEVALTRRDGRRVWVLATTFSIPMGDGKTAFVCMDVDITARKQAEQDLQELTQTLESRVQARTWDMTQALNELNRTQQELIQSEKLAALGSLVAGIAHELNTPIGNAVTVSSTLVDALADFRKRAAAGLTRAALDEFMNTVGEAGGMLSRNLVRAADLVSSFKQVAVDQNSHLRRPFALEEILSEVQIIMAPSLRKAHIQLRVDLRDKVSLDSFPGALTQALMILITNSITHAFEGRAGGEVSITAQAASAERVHITVADDGVGIPQAHQGRIFEPFFTTKLGKGGSGLGLHICYNVVTATLGGKVSVQSPPGGGTRMLIDIPLQAPPSTPANTVSAL